MQAQFLAILGLLRQMSFPIFPELQSQIRAGAGSAAVLRHSAPHAPQGTVVSTCWGCQGAPSFHDLNKNNLLCDLPASQILTLFVHLAPGSRVKPSLQQDQLWSLWCSSTGDKPALIPRVSPWPPSRVFRGGAFQDAKKAKVN